MLFDNRIGFAEKEPLAFSGGGNAAFCSRRRGGVVAAAKRARRSQGRYGSAERNSFLVRPHWPRLGRWFFKSPRKHEGDFWSGL